MKDSPKIVGYFFVALHGGSDYVRCHSTPTGVGQNLRMSCVLDYYGIRSDQQRPTLRFDADLVGLTDTNMHYERVGPRDDYHERVV